MWSILSAVNAVNLVNTVNDVTNAAAVRRRGKRRDEQRPPVADARVLDGIDLIDGIDGIDCGQD
jgi:hypothetical protein